MADAAADRRFDLLGLGECMVELFADQPLGQAPQLRRAYGGDVLNTLVAAAREGGRCGFISRVARDPFGPAMREAWAREGVDVSHAPLAAGDNGVYFISVSDSGEREFSYRRRDSPASQMTAADVDEAYIASSRMLLLSGITQALSPGMRQATQQAALLARRHGVRVVFDPNVRLNLWASQGGLAAARAAFADLVPLVDWLLPSHPADSVLLGDDAAALRADDLDGAAAALAGFAARCPHVALKLGPRGCLLATEGQVQHVDGMPAETVLDTTGAGDLWNGCFLVAMQQGLTPAQAALRAHRLAARKLAYRGAIPPAQLHAPLTAPRLHPGTLSQADPCVLRPAYDRHALPISVVHFGPGAFHRAHQAAFLDTLCHSDPRWGVCGVSLHSAGVRDALAPQDGLYTLATLGPQPAWRIIGCLRELLVAPEDPAAVWARLRHAQVRLVTTTVTEKGYCLDAGGALDLHHPDVAHDARQPQAPRSLPGYLVEALRQRRAAGQAPFVLMSCDNLPANGRKLKAALVLLARQQHPALAAWIEAHLICPNTMVDAITPATDDGLRQQVQLATGLHDAWPVQREAFAQWVIEAHADEGGPDWQRAGAIVTADVAAFERAKLWLLNGPHSTLAYWGLLKGHDSVAQAMADPELAGFLQRYMHDDVVPLLQAPGLDLPAYADAVLARFRNPAIQHQLAQIAQDGSQKLPVRVVAPMQQALARQADVSRFAVPLAAWLRFVRKRVLDGVAIADPLSAELVQIGQAMQDDASDIDRLLAWRAVMPAAVASDPRVQRALRVAYARLLPAA